MYLARNSEAKQKVVLTHVFDDGLQAGLEDAKIENPGAFVNLHRITAAHGDTGLCFSRQIREIAPGAAAALWIARHADGLHAPGPDVTRKQASMKSFRAPGEKFQGFGYFQRGDQINDRAKDANGIAGFLEAISGAAGFEKAREASGLAGTDGHGQSIARDGGSVNPRAAGFHGDIVDQEASFEIIGAIKKQIDVTEKGFGIARAEIGDDAFDGYGRIDRAKLALRGNGLGQNIEGVGFIEEGLTLQVRGLDEIAIDDSEVADAGANEQIGSGSADSAATDDGRPRGEQPLLPFRADPAEKHLARIFFLERIAHERHGPRRAQPQKRLLSYMIAPKGTGQATPPCYASSERMEA